MLKFTGKVLFVSDEYRDLPIKDKNGVPTQMTRRFRFTTIQAMVKDDDLKTDRPVVFKTVDLPDGSPLPKSGEAFTTPEVRSYQIDNGVPVVQF